MTQLYDAETVLALLALANFKSKILWLELSIKVDR